MAKKEDLKQYYKATEPLLDFLKNIDGSYEKFARNTGLSSRTIARLRNGQRINRETANKVFKTASSFGFSGVKDIAFELVGRESHG